MNQTLTVTEGVSEQAEHFVLEKLRTDLCAVCFLVSVMDILRIVDAMQIQHNTL